MTSRHAFAKWSLLLSLFILITLLQASIAGAATRDRLRWTVGCDGFTSRGGGIILNRDNTGQGRETFTITATDGNGNVIFSASESSWVGTEIFILAGVSFNWTTAPVANPIRLEAVSPAGNGQLDQVIYATIGSCTGLDFVASQTTGATETDFTPSASVPLNGTAPRPINPDLAYDENTGYLVVTNIGTVNLRSGDGVEYTIVGQVVHNEALIVIGSNYDQSWWFVRVDDIRGWVNNTLVAVRGDLQHIPVVPIQGELLPPRLFVFIDQPIYAAPGATALPICIIEGQLEYAIIGRSLGGAWYQIRAFCNNTETLGWISVDNGAVRNAGMPIPVADY